MKNRPIYIAGGTEACRYAYTYLRNLGYPVTLQPQPDAGHLLLDVPSFGPEGQLRLGVNPESVLKMLPGDVTVYGGNLNHPALSGYRTVDFLQDPQYLAQNAYLTAECALDVAMPYLKISVRGCPVLIIGWGRIGKCLGHILQNLGAQVTIAARKESDRAMAQALGFQVVDISDLRQTLYTFRLIYNTVPAPVLCSAEMDGCRNDCVCIDLASKNGIAHEDVIIARGLPGLHLPESSGQLITETFLRYY